MVMYECERCLKTFTLKGDYDRHVNRKKPCALNGFGKFAELVEKTDCVLQINETLNKNVKKLTKDIVTLKATVKELKKKIKVTDAQINKFRENTVDGLKEIMDAIDK